MGQKIKRRNRILDAWNTRLYASAPIEDGGGKPMLYLDYKYTHYSDALKREVYRDLYFGVNLRIKDYKKGKYAFPMEPEAWEFFLASMRRCIHATKPCLYEIIHNDWKWFGPGKRSEKMEQMGKLVCGRDESGIFIGVSVSGYEPVKFYVQTDGKYEPRYVNGESMTNMEIAELQAEAYTNLWEKGIEYNDSHCYMDDDELELCKEAQKKARDAAFRDRQKTQQQGNQQSGGGGGWNQPAPQSNNNAPSYDEDIPWG